jgi:ABC-type transporter Mla MlaB component
MDGCETIGVFDVQTGGVKLALAGRVTVADATRLYQIALDLSARGENVTVCCAAAEYLDAATIQVVLALGRDLTGRGRRCDVTGVTGPLVNLFRLAGLG